MHGRMSPWSLHVFVQKSTKRVAQVGKATMTAVTNNIRKPDWSVEKRDCGVLGCREAASLRGPEWRWPSDPD